ncbi:GNAT family N-acetyltransferase [Rhizobium sp. FY34]|uniref:GNAT family N-acetyltransferase n=1 Tax=Rhizobium sp. FY34 TaxID=2562309 RepID=UPI001FF00BC9|nr:GNAT family N-acetyltransferase [Rhizobium sp. FY34]
MPEILQSHGEKMSSPIASPPITFRTATQDDCAHLVLFADMATRRLTSFLWGQMAASGQSAFEVGRNVIRNAEDHFTHFRNWRVAEHQGHIIGALNGYVLPEPSVSASSTPDVVKPLNALKNIAAGTWYISAAALYSEYQGKGLGARLIWEAETIARSFGKDRLTLMVGSFNNPAYRLYQKCGFTEWARRPFLPFPGSDEGEWILMVKQL